MCLAIPGEVLSLETDTAGLSHGVVSFGGIRKRVCLAYVPEARVGDYVLVHAGFAINRLDETEAQRTLRALADLGAIEELAE